MPTLAAASKMEVFSGTVTFLLSMVRVTILCSSLL